MQMQFRRLASTDEFSMTVDVVRWCGRGCVAFMTSIVVVVIVAKLFASPMPMVASDRHGRAQIHYMTIEHGEPRVVDILPQVEAVRVSTDPQSGYVIHHNGEDVYLPQVEQETSCWESSHAALEQPLSWSPDGGRVAYASRLAFDVSLFVMDIRDGQVNRLTQHAQNDKHPAWSPDGQQIAYASYRGGNWDIYVLDADGGEPRRLTTHTGYDHQPVWSPDGRQIAFASRRDGNWDIYMMPIEGGATRRLTSDAASDGCPAWSASGGQILFVSDRTGHRELHVADLSGQVVRLTNRAYTGQDSQAPAQ